MWGEVGIEDEVPADPLRHLQASGRGPYLPGRNLCHAAGANTIAPNVSASLTARGILLAWNGRTHSGIEEIVATGIEPAEEPRDMERLQGELGTFLFDNAYTMVGLYLVDAVWPVGPRIEEWSEHVVTRDLRNINGYQWIEPRQ